MSDPQPLRHISIYDSRRIKQGTDTSARLPIAAISLSLRRR
jgi:hypothetical protein